MTIRLAPDAVTNPFPRLSLRTWVSPRRQGLATAAAVLALLLVIWLYAGHWYEERLLLEQRSEAVSEISAHGSALTSAINRRLARLQGLHAFAQTEGSEPDFGQKYERFAADLSAGSRGIRNLAVAPEGEVRYVFPFAGNEAVLGYQPLLDSRPEVVADVRQAIDTKEIIISGPIELVQGGLGLIARQAVFQEGRYWGLVNVVIDLQTLLSEAGIQGGSGELEYALHDDQGRVLFGPSSLSSKNPIATQILLPEGSWELSAAPRSGWSSLIWRPLLLFRVGSLISIVLVVSLVYLTINRQSWLAAAVEQQTEELSAANTLLEQRVEERTMELTMLLNVSRSIASTLELEMLLERVLNKLLPVVDYTGGAILRLEDGAFTIWAYHGPFSQESMLHHSYSTDSIIARRLIEEQKPVLISDVSDDSALAVAFREATGLHTDRIEYIRSWLGIPLVTRERVIGMLALHHREPAIYTRQNADLAMTFGNHVAVAIDNARLYEKAQRLAVLQERQRLSRELHDSVSQALYGIALGARTARKLLDRTKLGSQSRAALADPIDYILSLSEGGLAEMRALIFELRPESLESEGLVAALAKQATALQARHGIEVTTHLGDEPGASLPAKEALYRVTQEALHNVVKHAGATRLEVSLSTEDGQIALEIWDNGKGFDLNGSFSGHLGLQSMRERVEQVGGTLNMTSSPGSGTRIVAVVPLA
jgi:signal transduction histidine kinase